MTSCRCGNIAVYRVTKLGYTIPSECGQFCNVCLRKDSWYAIHYHDYKIENIVQPETNVRMLTYVNSNTVQDLSDKETTIHRVGSIYFIYDKESKE